MTLQQWTLRLLQTLTPREEYLLREQYGIGWRPSRVIHPRGGLEMFEIRGTHIKLPQLGFDHGVGHPNGLYARPQVPNNQRDRAFWGSVHRPKWPKMADAVIGAELFPFKLRQARSPY